MLYMTGRTGVHFPFQNLLRRDPIAHRSRIVPTRPLGAGIGVTSAPRIIDGVDQLRRFINGSRYGWQWNEVSLNELFAAYDERFFENRVLAAGVVSASSGSTIVTVSDVIKTDKRIVIFLRLHAPSIGTADMMSWHYFVELLAEDVGDGDVSTNLPVSKGRSRRGFPDVIIADR